MECNECKFRKQLAPLEGKLLAELALVALHPQHNLLGRLGLLVEDRLRLTSISALLSVVTPLTLCVERGLSSFVLRHLVVHMTLALLAVGAAVLWNVHHFE